MMNHASLRPRRAFTLVELLIVMMIISILSAMALSALNAAAQEGKRQRARTQITKIDTLIMEKWNSYRFRQLPIRIPYNTDPRTAAQARLYSLRELQRMEMPDRMSDITWTDPNDTNANLFLRRSTRILPARPALSLRYVSTTSFTPNLFNEQAECLYLILREMKDGDRSAINFFFDSEIGDTDNDGLKEILDPWGTPIRFLRWAPGYSTGVPDWSAAPYSQTPPNLNRAYDPLTAQKYDAQAFPDPFDPLKADERWNPNSAVATTKFIAPFALKPLIFSAGPDKAFDIVNGYYKDDGSSDFNYALTTLGSTPIPNDPYYQHVFTAGAYSGKAAPWIGACKDNDGDNQLSYYDNITNHELTLDGK